VEEEWENMELMDGNHHHPIVGGNDATAIPDVSCLGKQAKGKRGRLKRKG